MFIDPLYLIVMLVGLALSLGAQAWVKTTAHRWAQVGTRAGLSGAEVARLILRKHGIAEVRVEPVDGFLTDHYDPSTRTLRLSSANYHGHSVTAVGVAAHEVGHAIQHKVRYWPMTVRQRLVPVANVGTSLGIFLVMIGVFVGLLALAKLGAILFGAFVLFTLVTLPVEFDASKRAHATLKRMTVLNRAELEGVRRVLTAAAATYVAAAVTAVLQFLYFLLRAGAFGHRGSA